MSEHTEGPWGLSSEAPHIIKQMFCGREGTVMVASAMGGETSGPRFPESSDEVAANARLIAAAPELLDALEAIVTTWETGLDFSNEIGEARAAIAKATGA